MWHRWFAWYPVKVYFRENGSSVLKWRWLTVVEAKDTMHSDWMYREIGYEAKFKEDK